MAVYGSLAARLHLSERLELLPVRFQELASAPEWQQLGVGGRHSVKQFDALLDLRSCAIQIRVERTCRF